jgi:hypothetical protein
MEALSIEIWMLVAGILLVLGVLSSNLAHRPGVPA